MFSSSDQRRLAFLGLLFIALLCTACPKQQAQDEGQTPAGAAGSADSTAASGAAATDSPAAAGETPDTPMEQQEAADASGDKVPQAGPDSTKDEMEAPRTMLTAEELYKSGNCGMCHGQDQNGTPLGPPLRDLKANWDVPKLVAYFKDPAGYAANDPRLSANKGKYSVPMPPQRFPDNELSALAEWLLEK
ncbi:cytochrome c [bacterium]|nr:cytochrome c [bacterium]